MLKATAGTQGSRCPPTLLMLLGPWRQGGLGEKAGHFPAVVTFPVTLEVRSARGGQVPGAGGRPPARGGGRTVVPEPVPAPANSDPNSLSEQG